MQHYTKKSTPLPLTSHLQLVIMWRTLKRCEHPVPTRDKRLAFANSLKWKKKNASDWHKSCLVSLMWGENGGYHRGRTWKGVSLPCATGRGDPDGTKSSWGYWATVLWHSHLVWYHPEKPLTLTLLREQSPNHDHASDWTRTVMLHGGQTLYLFAWVFTFPQAQPVQMQYCIYVCLLGGRRSRRPIRKS